MLKNKIVRDINKQINLMTQKFSGTNLSQKSLKAKGEKSFDQQISLAIRQLGQEGIVLLKNDNDLLPIKKENNVAVFGRSANHLIEVGYGSGGDVKPTYHVGLFEAFDNYGLNYNKNLKSFYDDWEAKSANFIDYGYWGHWPVSFDEMILTKDIVENSKKESDVAFVFISRASGEDMELSLNKGSYYLTKKEEIMLKHVTDNYDKTVLIINSGNIIDTSFFDKYNFSSIVLTWQLGQEMANALTEVLLGIVSPSGKLTDTIAKSYGDYPTSNNFGGKYFNNYVEDIYVGYRYFYTFATEKIRYPIGYGLSYTDFDFKVNSVNKKEMGIQFDIKVTNVGKVKGKETITIFVNQKNNRLSKPKKIIVGFKKTGLLNPGDSTDLIVYVSYNDFSCYDEVGVTGYKNSFVLEDGEYEFYITNNNINKKFAYKLEIDQTICLKKLNEICVINDEDKFDVIDQFGTKAIQVGTNGKRVRASSVTIGQRDLAKRIVDNIKTDPKYTGYIGIKLSDIKHQRYSLDQFICQLTDKELADLTRGEGSMNSSLGIAGNAGAFGGITKSLRDKGIPPLITADGPSGIRIQRYTTLLPCATSIGCSYNMDLIEKVFNLIGQEASGYSLDVLLSPGMNIHRDPLCGRNFEYLSEDPLISGRLASYIVKGLQSGGVSACPKHFACNNQEFNRNKNDSRVSIRALREIYLKNFEYVIKEGKPKNIMTSYNKINGVYAHYNYDLVTTVLRKEWGYNGNVLTDWWMVKAPSFEFNDIKDNSYRTRAGVDVLMPGNLARFTKGYKFDKNHLETIGKKDGLTRYELARSAKHVLRFAMSRIKEE